jgi:preprotein translocase subunit SecB
VSELVARGGFPQLLLQPVNFEALFQQHLARTAEPAARAH